MAANGDFANWATPEMAGGGVGGAMDLAVGARSVVVTMEHLDSAGSPKLVRACTYPLTASRRVDVVITDLALLRRVDDEFLLLEVARGFEVDEVVALTEMKLRIAPDVATMQDALEA